MDSTIREGNKLPLFKVKDVGDRDTIIYLPKTKIILNDFWFSSCKPCIASIPTLKPLKSSYQNAGFEIIGISTDAAFTRQKWSKRKSQSFHLGFFL